MRLIRDGGLRRIISVGAAAALLSTVVASQSPVRSAPAPSVVGAATTVNATQSSSVLLELKTAVPYSLAADDTSAIAVDGRGRAVAAVLQRTGSSKPTEAAIVARFNGCDTAGCTPAPDSPGLVYFREATGHPQAPDGRATLSPGTYRLSVLTDGAPVTVTLRLGTATSTLALSTDTPAESGFVKANETAAVPLAPVAWSGGASLTLVSPNTAVLGFLQQDTPGGTVAGAAGACHFAGAPPLLGHFAPGCPFHPTSGGSAPTVGSIATETFTLGSDERARLATLLPAVAGSQALGFWSLRSGLTTSPMAFFVHLRLH